MDAAQLIEKFNPANAQNLTAEDIELMRKLTDAEIEVLAKAYPNQPTGYGYLELYDTNVAANKQIRQPSTWQNIHNLRKFNGKRNFIPWNFRVRRQPTSAPPTPAAKPQRRVVDLTPAQAAAALTAAIQQNPPATTSGTEETLKAKRGPKPKANPATQTQNNLSTDEVGESE